MSNRMLLLLLLGCGMARGMTSTAADQPNVLMIFTDDQGYNDVGCYGSEIPTPNIDRLANEGMRFTQFYAASSICTPSRFGLLTGQYPHRSKDRLLDALMFMSESDASRGLHAEEETYVKRLQETGYRTSLVGKWHLGHGDKAFWPTRHGFDTFFGHTGGCVDFFTLNYGNLPDWYRGEELVNPDGYATDVITDEAIKLLRRSRDAKQPFYLHLSYNAPHFGKAYNAELQQPENVMQPKQADLDKVQGIEDPLRRSFAAKTVGLDESIGRLLKVLDGLDLSEKTLVIFMTDHGGDADYGGSNKPLRGGKATLFEGGLRVPCIVRWPGRINAGSTTDAVGCAIDWYPTLMDILDQGGTAQGLDGRSMLPILLGDSEGAPRRLIWHTSAHAELNREPWTAIRDGDWKWVKPPGSEGMLFNLRRDPNEQRNLAAAHPQLAERLARIAGGATEPQ